VYTGFWWGNLRGKRPFGTQRHRWENNMKVDLCDVGCEGMDWIKLTQDRDMWWALVNVEINHQVP